MSDNTEKNRAHFNDSASTYNSKYSTTISQLISEIQARRDWIGVKWVDDISSSSSDDRDKPPPASSSSKAKAPTRDVRLLDYACGTGLISRALAPSITQSIGIDISESMVSEFNTTASNQGLTPSEMHAHVGNILSPSDSSPPAFSGPEFFNFDIVAVGLGFHHFDDPALAAQRLAGRLKRGGVLLIVDFLPHDHGHVHKGHGSAGQTVMHMGFSEREVRGFSRGPGLGRGLSMWLLGREWCF